MLCYTLADVLEITLNVQYRIEEFSYLPTSQIMIFSLQKFQQFLNFISSHDFNQGCGCDINDCQNDGILIILMGEDETEENILVIKQDRTEIFLNIE